MKILLTGGGTGGHITPILAVAHELKNNDPACTLVYVGERKGKFASIPKSDKNIDYIKTIFAGKFRRYHGESWLRRITDVRTIFLNIRDAFYLIIGIVQSIWLVRAEKPDVVFLKGGFVGVPVGLACALWRVPIVTHDSDSLPGLANRIIGHWARIHATAMPIEYYSYPQETTREVGVIVGHDYIEVSSKLQRQYRQQLSIPDDAKVIMITGGSSGAITINSVVASIVPKLLEDYPDLYVIHQTGIGKESVYEDNTNDRLQIFPLLKDMYVYSGAADIIITRAGANTLAEFGVQGKACIVIPSPHLAGGHQLKNAEYLEEQGAAVVLQESNLDDKLLRDAVDDLLSDDVKKRQISNKLASVTKKDAADKLADILLEISKGNDV